MVEILFLHIFILSNNLIELAKLSFLTMKKQDEICQWHEERKGQ